MRNWLLSIQHMAEVCRNHLCISNNDSNPSISNTHAHTHTYKYIKVHNFTYHNSHCIATFSHHATSRTWLRYIHLPSNGHICNQNKELSYLTVIWWFTFHLLTDIPIFFFKFKPKPIRSSIYFCYYIPNFI